MADKIVVSLTVDDDEALFQVATLLGDLADRVDTGEAIDGLGQLLRLLAITMSGTMMRAYERQAGDDVEDAFGFNLN